MHTTPEERESLRQMIDPDGDNEQVIARLLRDAEDKSTIDGLLKETVDRLRGIERTAYVDTSMMLKIRSLRQRIQNHLSGAEASIQAVVTGLHSNRTAEAYKNWFSKTWRARRR